MADITETENKNKRPGQPVIEWSNKTEKDFLEKGF